MPRAALALALLAAACAAPPPPPARPPHAAFERPGDLPGDAYRRWLNASNPMPVARSPEEMIRNAARDDRAARAQEYCRDLASEIALAHVGTQWGRPEWARRDAYTSCIRSFERARRLTGD